MQSYELKLFGPTLGSATNRMLLGEYVFTAEDDAAAVKHVACAFEGGLAVASYAVILAEGGRQVWDQATADRSR